MDGQEWRRRAACRDSDPSVFFPNRGGPGSGDRARLICMTCPVADPCLEYALTITDSHYDFGIWAGTDARDRRRVRQLRRQRVVA